MAEESLFEVVVGYADGFERAIAAFGLPPAELKEALLDANIEQCPSCKWWVDSFELLTDDDVIDGHCDNCRNP
jgi:hypothetical protein